MVDTHAGQSVVEVVLHEGRKHIVRRLLAAVDLPVSRLTRTAIGPVGCERMRSGSIRRLTRQEVGALKELVGSELSASSLDSAPHHGGPNEES